MITKLMDEALIKTVRENDKVVLMCIGTTLSIIDTYGPYLGTYLKRYIKNPKVIIVGEVKDRLTYLGLREKLSLYDKYPIIAIGSAVVTNKKDNKIGNYRFKEKPFEAGSGIGKDIIYAGNYRLKYLSCYYNEIINCKDKMYFSDLNFRFKDIKRDAYKMSRHIAYVLNNLS